MSFVVLGAPQTALATHNDDGAGDYRFRADLGQVIDHGTTGADTITYSNQSAQSLDARNGNDKVWRRADLDWVATHERQKRGVFAR